MSSAVELSGDESLSSAGTFRLRMERQCRQILLYRLAVLRERGQLLTPDEAALEWIERFASTFDAR